MDVFVSELWQIFNEKSLLKILYSFHIPKIIRELVPLIRRPVKPEMKKFDFALFHEVSSKMKQDPIFADWLNTKKGKEFRLKNRGNRYAYWRLSLDNKLYDGKPRE